MLGKQIGKIDVEDEGECLSEDMAVGEERPVVGDGWDEAFVGDEVVVVRWVSCRRLTFQFCELSSGGLTTRLKIQLAESVLLNDRIRQSPCC